MSYALERIWDERLAALLPADQAGRAADFLARLPPGYREQTTPAEAVSDLAEIDSLAASPAGGRAGAPRGGPASAPPGGPASGPPGEVLPAGPYAGHASVMGHSNRLVVRPASDPACTFRLRRFGVEGVELTAVLPLLESFGLVVVESIPMRLGPGPGGSPPFHVDDIGIRTDAPNGPEALRFVPEVHGRRLVDAIEASARGDADVDPLNRLVTAAGLDWRQVSVLRAYLRYWMQVAGQPLGDLANPLCEYPDVARALIAYFEARFDPDQPAGGAPTTAGGLRGSRERGACLAGLGLVAHLEQDRVLRTVLGLVDATLRTNYFRAGPGGLLEPLVLKLDGRAVPHLPPPRPLFETFVHGPELEGIHLRAGLVARGGIRWSERPFDFRTEVLDLAFAQVKKNAIIVPTGSKGGFVCRRPARPAGAGGSASRARPGQDEVRSAYEMFMAALLEITDNISAGRVVTPERVVAADGDDPYLVVAADKGTATFSDLANAISERSGFWLGDAFASGGSRGYDHKAMGITARGAWVGVRRHFRELGIDVAVDPIRVVGVGDMSGDVFGNGMLQSRAIRLLAAFDHRHVFVDPEPDPARSFEERRRLASLERSSWADYDPAVISAGGGVWPRDSKVVPISPEARAALGTAAAELSPPELMSAILTAPADLLWFGGIGTFVKAPEEPDVEVGDHANDAIRITSDRLRARVVAEGANLGVTQRARIRYSRRGGRINADFIDNAAGVATSDREVNLKILLALAIERGRLAPDERDGYLARSEGEVAAEVLRQVDHSVAALNRAAATSERDLDAYEALIDSLEASGRFDRHVEVLPDASELQVRRAAGAGLIRPELATILAYAKSDLVDAIEASPRCAEPMFLDAVVPYFPSAIREDFADLVPDHRLYPQLVATDVAGEIVDQMGVVWAHDLAAELGRGLDEVASAFWVARAVTGAGELWAELESLAGGAGAGVDADSEAALHACVARAAGALARAYLVLPVPFDAAAAASKDHKLASLAAPGEAGVVPAAELTSLAASGCPPDLAERFLIARRRAVAVEAGSLAGDSGVEVAEALETLRLVDEVAGTGDLSARVQGALDASPPPHRLRVWQARALLDDVAAWRRGAALAALRGAGGAVAARVQAWAGRHQDTLAQAAALRSGAPAEADALAVASLALRRLGAAADLQR